MVRAILREHFDASGVQSGHPHRMLDRLSSTVSEEDMLKAIWGDLGNQSGRL